MRVAALTGYFETMSKFGVDPGPLLKEEGLSAAVLANPEGLISARAAIRLLERSAIVTECITFGLRMAEGRVLAHLGAASLLIAHEPTLRQALAALTEFRSRINSTLVLHLWEGAEEAILREDFSLSQPEPSRQASNLAMGVLARICSTILGDSWSPRTVCFSHQPPPQAELPLFSQIFRCRPEFDCEFNGLVIKASDLDRLSPKADDQLASHARQLLETVMNPMPRTKVQDVEQLIRRLLPSGRASVQTCAETMGTTVRTLQRMLDAEGQSFTSLLNRARMQLATQYLANPRMRVTDIANMLGYSSIGAFTRWHVQTFGLPPMRRRRDARSGATNTSSEHQSD
jgi:AraC-like DNA-binding protein